MSRQKREKEQRDKVAEQDMRGVLQAKREAERIFSEKQQQKAKQARDYEKKLQEFNAAQMVTFNVSNV